MNLPGPAAPAALPAPFYRLLFLDLDGTLVDHNDVVSPRTRAALSRAVDAGCIPVICTGRNRCMVEQIAAQWHGHGYAILSNGAIIAEWETGRVLQKIAVAANTVQLASEIAHEFEVSALLFGVHAEEDGGELIYTDGRFPPPPEYLVRHPHRLRDSGDRAERDGDRQPVGVGVYGPLETVEALALAWQERLGPSVAVYVAPDPKYRCWCVFFNAVEADKAHAAARVADMLAIPRERTLAIGDHLNDLNLLRWAGLGICMGDGHDSAKASAAHITGTLADDGAAEAIERFVLEA